MIFTNQIGTYQLVYFGKRTFDNIAIAQINLWNHNNQYIGKIAFYRDGQNIPINGSIETSDPKRASLRMHERQIDSVVDMLRNEKPCNVYYAGPKFAYLFTGREPIGEEESEQ